MKKQSDQHEELKMGKCQGQNDGINNTMAPKKNGGNDVGKRVHFEGMTDGKRHTRKY